MRSIDFRINIIFVKTLKIEIEMQKTIKHFRKLEFAVIRFYDEIRSFINLRKSKQMKLDVESET